MWGRPGGGEANVGVGRGILARQLEPRWVQAGGAWGTLCSKLSGAVVVWAWNVLGCFVFVSP